MPEIFWDLNSPNGVHTFRLALGKGCNFALYIYKMR